MRYSDPEWELVTARAGETGLAVGAWIGQVAVDAASGRTGSAGLPDLIRLHADVIRVGGLLDGNEPELRSVLEELVRRLDVAVDAVVAEVERGGR